MDSNHQYLEDKPCFVQRLRLRRVFDESLATADVLRAFWGSSPQTYSGDEARDPPYTVPIEGHASGLGAIHHRPFPMASGEMGPSSSLLAQFAAASALAMRS